MINKMTIQLTNLTPRKYQQDIFETCKSNNCLVVIPTGLGKTLILLMLAIDRINKYPNEKILFLCPTKPLCLQQLEYFKKNISKDLIQFELFTGKTKPSIRKDLWKNANIVFSTPQTISNDLANGLYDLKDVSLLVEDESHHCLNNYAYTTVANIYKEQAINQRIIGATASVGVKKDVIKQIMDNLNIQKVEIRTRESDDVKEYLQETTFHKIYVDLSPRFNDIKCLLKNLINARVVELRAMGLLLGNPIKSVVLEELKKVSAMIKKDPNAGHLYRAMSVLGIIIRCAHALELLETQSLHTLNDFLDETYKGKTKGMQTLSKSEEFIKATEITKDLLSKGQEHEKMDKLKEIILEQQKINPNFKALIFSNYRTTTGAIAACLNRNAISAAQFVGQSKKTTTFGESGSSQIEQKKIVQDFKDGKIKALACTSVHPEEYIVLKKDNKIMIKKIGEFVNSFIIEESKRTICKKIDGWESLTSDGIKTMFKPITHIHKHPIQSNMIKMKTSSGFDCMITEDHSLFSFNNHNKFLPSSPDKNQFTALVLKSPNIENKQKIDIIKEITALNKDKSFNLFGSISNLTQSKIRLLKTDYTVLSCLSHPKNITDISKTIDKDYSTIMDSLKRMKDKGYINRLEDNLKNISEKTLLGDDYYKFLQWFFKNVKYYKGKYRFPLNDDNLKQFEKFFPQNLNVDYGKITFPRFIELNEDLAKFLGYYVSEGWSNRTTKSAGVFLAAQNKDIRNEMIKSIKNGLHINPRINNKGVGIDSQVAYHLIKSVFKAGIGAYNKEVPEMIFTAPDNVKWAFLYAYYWGDGYSDDKRIVFTTVSKKLVMGLVLLLRMLGIQKITLHKQKHIYRLHVLESTPFAKIDMQNTKRGHAYYSLIPKALNDNKYFNLFQNKFHYNQKTKLKCRENAKWKNDICFDYIKEIKKIDKPKYVYDLSVKDTENFIGGTGLICLHNSIGEEGLDLPEVNAAIFYEPVPSAIRSIQRRGRIGRMMKGSLYVLVARDTIDEIYYNVAIKKEEKMHKSLKMIENELSNNNLNSTLSKYVPVEQDPSKWDKV